MPLHHGMDNRAAAEALAVYRLKLLQWGRHNYMALVKCQTCGWQYTLLCKSVANNLVKECPKCATADNYKKRWEKRSGMRVAITKINPLSARFTCLTCGNVRDTEPHGRNPCSVCYAATVDEERLQKIRVNAIAYGKHNGWKIVSVDSHGAVYYCKSHREKFLVRASTSNRFVGFCKECRSDQLSQIMQDVACKRLSTEDYQQGLDRFHGGSIRLVGDYDAKAARVNVACIECGFTWDRGRQNTQARGCPNCANIRREGNWSRKYEFSLRGRKFTVQGYEDKAIRILAQDRSVSKILDQHRHKIAIVLKLPPRPKRYFPDLFLPDENTVVEVKSIATAGLGRMRKWKLSELKRKALATRRAGYKFKLMLINFDGREIRMPRDWLKMTRGQIRKKIEHACDIDR